jgi:hypothetical protein
MGRVWQWLTSVSDDPLAALINFSIALLTLIALGVTSYLSLGQLQLTRLSVQNNLIYQMQRDERQVGADYAAGHASASDIFAEMQSVYIQNELGSIPPRVWLLFNQDFCKIMTNEHLRREWNDMTRAPFSAQFIGYMAEIEVPSSPVCKGKKE